jgi:hypothetical protein
MELTAAIGYVNRFKALTRVRWQYRFPMELNILLGQLTPAIHMFLPHPKNFLICFVDVDEEGDLLHSQGPLRDWLLEKGRHLAALAGGCF